MATTTYGLRNVRPVYSVTAPNEVAPADPSVTLIDGTNFLFAYETGDTLNANLSYRVYGFNGNSISGPNVLSNLGGSQRDVDLTTLSNGNTAAVYINASGLAGGNVNYALIGDNGITASGTITTITNSFDPDVTALTNGNFVVTWFGVDIFDNIDVKFSLRSSNGGLLVDGGIEGDEFTFGTAADPVRNSSVAALPGGGFVIAYQFSYSGSGELVCFQIYDPNGAPVGQPRIISQNNSTLPEVTPLGTGGFAITYTSGSDVYVSVHNSSGGQVGSPTILVNVDDTVGVQSDPSITALAGGYFMVSWTSRPDPSPFNPAAEINARLFGPDGQAVGPVFTVDSSASFIGETALETVSGTTFMLAWRDSNATSLPDNVPDSINAGLFDVVATTTGDNTGETLNGSILTDIMFGNGGNDTLNGAGGNDDLDGGTGADTMNGGTGSDVYRVDNSGDVIIETAGPNDADYVYASASYILPDYVEVLNLEGTANINGTGNSQDNGINGNSGNNVLNGGGGSDFLAGHAGNDTYVIDGGDTITEQFNEGTDTVQSSAVSYTLTANVENLTLTSASNANGAGNTLNNVLTGNNAANYLYGLGGNDTLNGGGGNDILVGGVGTDTMAGGLGDDTYAYDAGDTITEAANAGIDLVQSTAVTCTLTANVENLTLTSSGAANGAGNALNNTLTGNNAANYLYGLDGNDRLNGGGGDDIVVGGNGNDVVYGGAGKDNLAGSAGADYFDFKLISESVVGASRDGITDFSHAEGDKINLSQIDANSGVAGDQAFAFIGDAAFTAAGQVRYSGGILQVNIDGALGTDMEIQITGSPALLAGDFVL